MTHNLQKQTNPTHRGLTNKEVECNRKLFGTNIITPIPTSILQRFNVRRLRNQIQEILTWVTLFQICHITYLVLINDYEIGQIKWPLYILMAITMLTTYFAVSYNNIQNPSQPKDSENLPYRVDVIRNESTVSIPNTELVVGDIVQIKKSDVIPADGQLLESSGLMVKEILHSKERVMVKSADGLLHPCVNLYGPQFVLRSSIVLEGQGLFRVIRVGDETEFAKDYRTHISTF